MNKQKGITQMVEFNLIEGIDDASFLKAARIRSRFLKRQKGFIKKQLFKSEGNQWVDIIHWATKDEAQKAADAFQVHSSSYPYVLMISPSSVKELYLYPFVYS